MTRLPSRTWLRWAGGLLLLLVVLSGALIVAAPWWLDLPAVRSALERQVSAATQGEVAWNELQLRSFPRPHAVLRGARIEMPGVLSGRADEIEIQPGLRALLRGDVQLQRVRVVRPVLSITLAHDQAGSGSPREPMENYRRAMAPIVSALRRTAPELALVVEDARLEITAPALPAPLAASLSLVGHTDADGLTLDATASGALAQKLRIEARLAFADLKAAATIEASGLRLQPLLDAWLKAAPVGVQCPDGSLRVEVQTDGQNGWHASVVADAPLATVVRGKGSVTLAPAHVDAVATARGGDIEVKLRSVRLGDVVPAAQAMLQTTSEGTESQASLAIAELDVARLRDAALALAADHEAFRPHATRVRAGRATDLRLSARAATLAGLMDSQALTASLQLDGGAWLVPTVERELTGITGQVAWTDGTWTVRDAAGRVGGSSLSGGTLDYRPGDPRLRAELRYDIDLAQALELARQSLRPAQRVAWQRLQTLAGRAQGRFEMGPPPGRWKTELAVTGPGASARIEDLPWPVMLRTARLAITSERVSVSAVSGSVGQSTFQQAGAELRLGPSTRVVAAAGSASLDLDELYPWLRRQPGLEDRLRDGGSLTGQADVTLQRLASAAQAPGDFDFELTVRPRQVNVAMKDLPGLATIDTGAIHLTPAALRLDDVRLGLLDASMRVSGVLSDYRTDALRADLSVAEGSIDQAWVSWVWQQAELAPALQPALPLRFTASQLLWSQQGGVDLRMRLEPASGARVEADLSMTDRALEVRALRIQDRESDATIGARLQGRMLDLSFSGALAHRTIRGLLKPDGADHTAASRASSVPSSTATSRRAPAPKAGSAAVTSIWGG